VHGLSKTLVVILIAMSWTAPATSQQASAKKMYRCGTNFQDKPCDGSAPAAVAPAAKVVAPAAPEPTKVSAADARSAQQKQIRCENFSRQAAELRDRQKSTPKYAESIGVQLKSLETRMSTDSC
jgi:type IV secretory pathway VirB10-like protein